MKIIKNIDKDLVQQIESELIRNGGYCPCRIKRTPDSKCMCKEFREQFKRKELGECHCGLYVIVED